MHAIGKIIFVLIFLGGMLAIVGTILGSLGMLPDSLYTSYYQTEDALSARFGAGASSPALQQFEGHWKVEITPVASSSDISTCNNVEGYVVSHNGNMQGILHSFAPSASVTVSVAVDEKGVATGTLQTDAQYSGSLTATLNNGTGEGSWSDSIDCSGSITFSKVSPATDPVAGHVVSVQGSVTLNRGGRIVAAYPGMPLYAGDVLTTGSGSSARLGIGLDNTATDVGSSASYPVPNLPGQ